MSANNIIIKTPHLCTKLPILAPRYKDSVALLAKYKVDQSTPIVIVEFTKAKHLLGQRYAIQKNKAIRYPVDSNGKIPCYAVPMSALGSWESSTEVAETAKNVFDN